MAKKYIDAELLLKEIESRMGDCDANSKNPNQLLWAELAALIPFIDSLQQEQPCDMAIDLDIIFSNMKRNEAIKQLEYLNKVYGEQSCDTCTNDKGCVACKDGELWEGKEQPSEDLEKEIKTWIPAHIVGGDKAPWKELKDAVIQWAEVVARHFYILGLKNNIPVTQITLEELAKEGEPVSEDLEEEINRWQGCEAFPEGTPIRPLPKAMKIVEDTAHHFAEWQKSQMLKDAVEGEVCKDHIVTEKPFYFYQSRLIELPDNLKEGDKVKIVIVKED